jgi:O-antigen/teichoic acid export membrane protein
MVDSSNSDSVTESGLARSQRAIRRSLFGITPHADLKQKTIRGGAATILGQGLNFAVQISSLALLARLLSPTDYGLQGMVLTLTGVFALFQDAGLSAATVQSNTLTHEQISTLFWVNCAAGAFFSMLIASLGPFMALFYKDHRLLWITIVSATVFFLNGIAVQHRALMNRSMRFVTIAKIDAAALILSTVICIVMAVLGFGYWSLVVRAVSTALIAAIGVFVAVPWLPGGPSRLSEIRPMMRFGGTVTLNSLVTYIGYNTEKILLGRFWGAAPLGLYGRAYQLANLPVQQLMGAVGTVAFPVLSRLQDDAERLHRVYFKFHTAVVSITVPVVICCTLFADEIIGTLLGPKWAGTATILRLLSPTILFFALVNPLAWYLKSTGRVARSLYIALVIAPVVIIGVVAGLRHGPAGVALGYSTAMVLLSVPLVAWVRHGTGIKTRDYLNCIKLPVVAGVTGGAAGWLFRAGVHSHLQSLPLLIAEVAISLLVYAWLLLYIFGQKPLYLDLLSNLLQRKSEVTAET